MKMPEPRYSLMMGDCIEMMKTLPDGSVDMVCTDPPYGTTACKWDTVIPFDAMWEQLGRIAKSNAAIVLMASQPFTSALVMSNPKMFRYSWVWVKNNAGGFAQAKNKPMPKHEDVVVFSSAKTGHVGQCKNRMEYYPQGLKPYGKTVKNSKLHRASAFGERKNARESYVQEFTGYPDSVLSFDVQRDTNHPTQKPVALMEYLIRTYTHTGGRVLDFTMGSGTTGVACLQTGRRFVGIERDPEYFQIARDRIGSAA